MGAVAEGFAFLTGALGGIFEKQLSSSCCACETVRPSHANYLNSSSDNVVHTLRILVMCRSANGFLSVVALLMRCCCSKAGFWDLNAWRCFEHV